MQLFMQRAGQVRRYFAFAEGEANAVARICQLTEGLPLAIELAAAAPHVRSCATIADAIAANLSELTTVLRSIHERHRSMWATFEYSNLRTAVAWEHSEADGGEYEVRLVGALADYSFHTGMLNELRVWIEQAHTRQEAVSKLSQAKLLSATSQLAFYEGNDARSLAFFEELIAERDQVGWTIPCCLERMAAIAAAQGAGERAARLWGVAETVREATAMPMDTLEIQDYERWVSAARTRFDESAFAAAWAAGRALTVAQAIAEALNR